MLVKGDKIVARALTRSERAATRVVWNVLRARLGLRRAVLLLLRVLRDQLRGEPFARLGAPADERDRLSRAQAGGLVLLDRHVGALDRALADDVCRAAVDAGAGLFLAEMIPFRTVEELRANAKSLVDRFFNAEGESQLDDTTLRFTVTRCRFTELLAAVGASHLMPLFCAADYAFFSRADRPEQNRDRLITLRRTQTRAEGAASCDFVFAV